MLTTSGAILLSVAWTAWCQVPHQHHPPQSAEEYAKVLADPSRDAWQKPHDVIAALALKPGDVVADIGAGDGYFSRRLARHAARVYAVDIDPKLLEMVAKDAPANLVTVLADRDDPKLQARSVDVIFVCDVLHHIENRPSYYPKLAAALKPGGKIVIIDFLKKPLPVGPPLEMKLTEAQIVRELKQAGFSVSRKHEFLPYQYFLEFNR